MSRKKLLFLFLGLMIGGLSYRLALWGLADGFSIHHICGDFSKSSSQEVSQSRPSFVFDQPYHYLGKGSQCYVFESADGRYVIKFFKMNRFRLPKFVLALKQPSFQKALQEERLLKKERKKAALFSSCQLAFDELKEETGLIYLHVHHIAAPLLPKLTIQDALKRSFEVDLNDVPFMVQLRAQPLLATLSRLIQKGNQQEIDASYLSLIRLLHARYAKQIEDHDSVICKNLGFKDGQAVYLDLGQFFYEESLKNKVTCTNEMRRNTLELKKWLKERAPKQEERFEEILTSFLEANIP